MRPARYGVSWSVFAGAPASRPRRRWPARPGPGRAPGSAGSTGASRRRRAPARTSRPSEPRRQRVAHQPDRRGDGDPIACRVVDEDLGDRARDRRTGTCRCTTPRSRRPSRGARGGCCRRSAPGPSRRGRRPRGSAARQPRDVVDLARRVVDAGEQRHREPSPCSWMAASRSSVRTVASPGARPDDDEVARPDPGRGDAAGTRRRSGRTGTSGRR